MTINVTDVNESPTDITMPGGSVAENSAAGTLVATLSTVDPDAGETFSYSIQGGSALFEIVGDEVRVKAGADIDYETATSHDITVEVTDAAGATYSETITINVQDVQEYNIITGTPNADTLIGTAADDMIDGLAGNDRIYGGDGNDIIDGNAGRDRVYGEGGDPDRLLPVQSPRSYPRRSEPVLLAQASSRPLVPPSGTGVAVRRRSHDRTR